MELTGNMIHALDVRMQYLEHWEMAAKQAAVRSGLQGSYWRREAKRRRRAYNEAKALTFADAYSGTYTTRLK